MSAIKINLQLTEKAVAELAERKLAMELSLPPHAPLPGINDEILFKDGELEYQVTVMRRMFTFTPGAQDLTLTLVVGRSR